MSITITDHDDYTPYGDAEDSIDVPSELNYHTDPSPNPLRKTVSAQQHVQYSITDWGPISSFLGINMKRETCVPAALSVHMFF